MSALSISMMTGCKKDKAVTYWHNHQNLATCLQTLQILLLFVQYNPTEYYLLTFVALHDHPYSRSDAFINKLCQVSVDYWLDCIARPTERQYSRRHHSYLNVLSESCKCKEPNDLAGEAKTCGHKLPLYLLDLALKIFREVRYVCWLKSLENQPSD